MAVEVMRRKLGLPEDRVVVTLGEYGNTLASSMPLALDECIRDGRLKRGMRVAFIATAAGFSAGIAIVEY